MKPVKKPASSAITPPSPPGLSPVRPSKTGKAVDGGVNRNELRILQQPGKTEALQLAESMLNPAATNAAVAQRFASQGGDSAMGITEAAQVLTAASDQVKGNDLSGLEAMLTAQALTLNVMFAELARRAALNMGTHMEATETYMRLALRTQAQSRATAETLGALKNPPVVYAKQANFSAGHQQVLNNAGSHAHTVASPSATNELLEVVGNGERLDIRAEGSASALDSVMAPLGASDRTQDPRRETKGEPQRLQRGQANDAARAESPARKSTPGSRAAGGLEG